MSSPVILLVSAFTFCAAQSSCKGRCGGEYYRGFMCQCDYNCLSYGECCRDYESQCTTENSCKGRCGESFKRGRLCSCDSDCFKYKQCCEDYNSHCNADESTQNEANELTFNKGKNPDDHFFPSISPTSYPPDDSSDDINVQIFPDEEFYSKGLEDPGASPIPEGTSGFELSTADQLVQVSTGPTLQPDTPEFWKKTVTVFSQTETTPSYIEPTQADDSLSTHREVPTESTDASDSISSTYEVKTLPQPTSTEAPTSAPQTDVPGQMSWVMTMPASSIMDLTLIPEITTSNPGQDYTVNNSVDATADPTSDVASTSVSPGTLSKLDVLMSHIPSTTAAVQDDTTVYAIPEAMDADPKEVTPDLIKPQTTPTSKPQDKPHQFKPPPAKPTQTKPVLKPDTKPLNIDDSRNYQADGSNDTNLCNGKPISAITKLRNGTIVVFRGHYFWFLDRNRVPGPARGITQVWGVPSPIDTVFTRCNCQGKTYIFRGTKYWRFENDVLDHGYPKVIQTGFDGLRGHITAALSVPQYQRRKESVYFFKRGGLVQKYSYQFGTSPTCGRKPRHTIYTIRNRMVPQAESSLGPVINIRTSWKGFPSVITAAVSIPSTRESEDHKYYIFSRSNSYNVRMDGERPIIATPTENTSPQSNNLFQCPQEV